MTNNTNPAGGNVAAGTADAGATGASVAQASATLAPEIRNAFNLVISALQSIEQRLAAAENVVANFAGMAENFIPQSIDNALISELQKLETFAKAEGSSVVGIIRELATRTLGLFHSAPPNKGTDKPAA